MVARGEGWGNHPDYQTGNSYTSSTPLFAVSMGKFVAIVADVAVVTLVSLVAIISLISADFAQDQFDFVIQRTSILPF